MADEFIRFNTTIFCIDSAINKAPTERDTKALFELKDVIYSQQRYPQDIVLQRYLDEIETLEAQLRARDKQYNKLLDYVKTSICPTCDNCCSLCPVMESNFVQCCCCGESIPLLIAHTDLNGDYICDKCEKEGAE